MFTWLFWLGSPIPSSFAQDEEPQQSPSSESFIDERELPRESTLPYFRPQVATKRRNVPLKNRFELGVGMGYLLAEPVSSEYNPQVMTTFHFDEVSGIHLVYSQHNASSSSYAQQLEGPRFGLKFSLTPRVESSYFGYYQFSAYYGKLSFSKSTVFNWSIYGLAGLGQFQYADGSIPSFSFGIGQKIYLTRSLTLRGDLLFFAYSGLDLPKVDLKDPLLVERVPLDAIPRRTTIDQRLALYLSYLF